MTDDSSNQIETTTPALVGDIWRDRPEWIKRFVKQRPDYEKLCDEVAYTLRKILEATEIDVANITARAKTLDSFLDKVHRKAYPDPFENMTDFAGVRVVAYYPDQLAQIRGLVTGEFNCIEVEDKAEKKADNQFGYAGIHFIVTLGERSSGARYDGLKNLKCEIQIRTMLQDVWAVVQHRLAYKREKDIPKPLLRQMNSLAGLFELADDYYRRIRD